MKILNKILYYWKKFDNFLDKYIVKNVIIYNTNYYRLLFRKRV